MENQKQYYRPRVKIPLRVPADVLSCKEFISKKGNKMYVCKIVVYGDTVEVIQGFSLAPVALGRGEIQGSVFSDTISDVKRAK